MTASSEATVAHVWRRLGFGPAPGDVQEGVAAGGPSAVIEQLLARPTTAVADWAWPPDAGDWTDQARWLTRLFELFAHGSPIQERVSWILAGVLVAGISDEVAYADLKEHHNRLRMWPAAPSYKSLLYEVADTGAMQKYLNGTFSEPPHPNENLARELLELFSLGVTNPGTGAENFAEADVKEIARALTGYRMDLGTRATFFEPAYWDSGDKTFLGSDRGAAGLVEVIDAIVEQDSYRYFLPRRIYRDLVGSDPSAGALEDLGAVWGAHGDINALVAHIARRPEFVADEAIGNRVKSPVELLAGAIRILGIQDCSSLALGWAAGLLRQYPLRPPDVNGWDAGWLHPTHLVLWSRVQHSFCVADRGPAADGTVSATPAAKQSPTLRRLYAEASRDTAAEMALQLAGLHDTSSTTRAAIDAYARTRTTADEPWSFARACGVMELVFNSPEFLVA